MRKFLKPSFPKGQCHEIFYFSSFSTYLQPVVDFVSGQRHRWKKNSVLQKSIIAGVGDTADQFFAGVGVTSEELKKPNNSEVIKNSLDKKASRGRRGKNINAEKNVQSKNLVTSSL
jgi:hypothetical protein